MRIADPEETLKNLQMFLEDLQQYRDLLGDEERFDDAEKKRSLLNQNYGTPAAAGRRWPIFVGGLVIGWITADGSSSTSGDTRSRLGRRKSSLSSVFSSVCCSSRAASW